MKKRQNVINILVLIVYVLFQVLFVVNHEAWRDESQAWILARNSSFFEILQLCSSEGHPCLWFFILKICSLLGLSFHHISLISLVAMAIASSLLLWQAPFSFFSKICILLSPIFFYYNPVISRIYSIVLLLIVLLCSVWKKRFEHIIIYGILIALLFQTHILVAGLAIGCLIDIAIHYKELLRKKVNMLGFVIPLISLVCMCLELRQTRNTETFIHVNLSTVLSGFTLKNIPSKIYSVSGKFDSGLLVIDLIFLLACFLMIVTYIIRCLTEESFKNITKDTGIVFFCALLIYWGIIILIRKADHAQMAIVFLMILLFFCWTATDSGNIISGYGTEKEMPMGLFKRTMVLIKPHYKNNFFEVWVVACLVLLIPQSVLIAPIKDLKGQYSGSLEIAKLTELTVPNDSIVIIQNNSLCTSIVAYLYESDNNFILWDIDNGCEFQIHKWGRDNIRALSDDTILEAVKEDFNGDENIYYVRGVGVLEEDDTGIGGMTLIGKNSVPNEWDEYYQLYKVSIK